MKNQDASEWLRVVEALDELMKLRVLSDTPKPKMTLLDKDAVEALNTAYSETLRYYNVLIESGKRDEVAQSLLSRLWENVGTRMRRYKPALATLLKATNRFWLKAVTWEKETVQKMWAHLNSIRTNTNILAIRADSFARATTSSVS
jgi:hypothetical protein